MTESPDKPNATAMPRRKRLWRHMRRLPGRLAHRLTQTAFVLLMLLALYVTTGRLLMPLVADRAGELEAQLSRSMGVPVSIGALEGSWFRFGPRLEVRELAIGSGDAIHRIGNAFINPDLSASILQRRIVIESLTISHLDLGFQQDASGRWNLTGLTGSGPGYTQQILDFVLGTRDIVLTEASLRARTNTGIDVQLNSLYLELQNRGDRHELRAQFRVGDQAGPSQVLVDMEGDPRGEFQAGAYATANGVDVAAMLAGMDTGAWQLDTLRGDASLWANLDTDGLRQVTLSVANLALDAMNAGSGQVLALANAGFTLAAAPEARADGIVWNLAARDIGFDWQGTPWDIPSLQVAVPLPAQATLAASAPELELGMLNALATSAFPLPARARDALLTLAPSGSLRNVRIESARDGSYPGAFSLRANLDEVAVNAWTGAPAGSGVDGYVELDAFHGFAEVDSDHMTLHLPRLFPQPWAYDSINARISWDIGPNGALRIASTPIVVEAPGLSGRVQFDLHNSRDAAGQRVSELGLLVGVERMDVALRDAYLPRLPRLQATMDWLRAALQGGTLRDSGLMLRTSTLRGSPPQANSFASWFKVEEGSLRFLPEWPLLENIEADVVVRERNVDVTTRAASIAGIALSPATATLRPLEEGGSLLNVRGEALTETGIGLDFLRTTPIRNQLGAFLDDWTASGMLDVDVALAIPLGNATREREVAVDVVSTASTLDIPAYALEIGAIEGPVHWHSASGLEADELRAVMFGAPVTAGIETLEEDGRRTTRITAEGRATVNALRNWPAQPAFVDGLLGYMRGGLNYSATLDILGRDAPDGVRSRLALRSNLAGVQSTLPAPLGKSANAAAPFELELAFLEDSRRLNARYDDFLSTRLVLGMAGIERGQLFLGDLNRDFTARQSDENTPGLLINGSLPDFDYGAWQEVAANLNEANTDGGDRRSLAEYLRLIDVDLGTLRILGQELSGINVQVRHDEGGWQIEGSNPLLAGHFTIPDDRTRPWFVNLDYLRFPPREEPEPGPNGEEPEKVDLLANVDPRALPPFDFNTAELSIGEQTLGAFSFELRPNRSGAAIANFLMTSPEATITDSQQADGASIDWRYANGMHTSTFTGLFAAGNLAVVLPNWGHDASVASRSARFDGTLRWSGSPVAFTLKEASGQMQLDITNGRFVSIDAGSSRLFGALNFDSLIRRLQLDFSDIFGSGFAFDTIEGNLTFRDGVVTTNEGGVLIDGPSSRINISGEIDLAQETIAADMQVQIPLGQNISMLAGLLGAWPIAVSTYIASKIFQEQVDEFATLIYRLDGPWETPTAGFEPGETVTPPPAQPNETETPPDANR